MRKIILLVSCLFYITFFILLVSCKTPEDESLSTVSVLTSSSDNAAASAENSAQISETESKSNSETESQEQSEISIDESDNSEATSKLSETSKVNSDEKTLKIAADKNEATVGSEVKLNISITPANYNVNDITVTTSNKNISEIVNKNGEYTVLCKNAGEITIIAKIYGLTSTVKIKISKNEAIKNGIAIKELATTITEGDIYTPQFTISNGYNFRFEMYIHNTNIAVRKENLQAQAVMAGTTTITIKASQLIKNETSDPIIKEPIEFEVKLTVLPKDKGNVNGTGRFTSGDYFIEKHSDHIELLKYNGSAEKLTLPSSFMELPLTVLRDNAFQGTKVKELVIPDSVKILTDLSLYNQPAISRVTLGKGITEIRGKALMMIVYMLDKPTGDFFIVGDGLLIAYSGNSQNVVIPNGVKCIETRVFDAKPIKSLTLPEGLIKIKSHTFSSIQITSIVFPSTLKYIGDYAFEGCSSLQSVDMSKTNATIGAFAFNDCRQLTRLKLPPNIKEIAFGAFQSCPLSAEFSLPSSVEKINTLAFSTSAIKTLILPSNLIEIGEKAFYGASVFTEVVIPASVKIIGKEAFASNSLFKKLTLKSNPKIGEGAFDSCHGLLDITFPDGYKHANIEAFYSTAWFRQYERTPIVVLGDVLIKTTVEPRSTFTVPAGVKYIAPRALNNAAEKIIVPEGVIEIMAGGCGGASASEIVLPNSLVKIGDRAFENCDQLTKITFGKGLKYIGEFAFAGVDAIDELSIPSSVSYIGEKAFSDMRWYKRYNSGFLIVGDGVLLKAQVGKNVVIPSTIKMIASDAFIPSWSIETVTIPDSVTIIGADAFRGCKYLKQVTGAKNVVQIGMRSFSGCESLSAFTFGEKLKTIDEGAFINTKLENVVIPKSVTLIESIAFGDCKSLKSVKIYNNKKVIELSAFYMCNIVVTIPQEAIIKIDSAFSFSTTVALKRTDIEKQEDLTSRGISFIIVD